MQRIILLLILIACGVPSLHASVVRIPDNNCVALSSAVSSASQTAGGVTTILLARNGSYAACVFSLTAGAIEIDGQGATLQYPMAQIASAASLALRNLSITAPSSGTTVSAICNYDPDMNHIHPASDAICNHGTLSLESVTVHDMTVSVPCSSAQNYCAMGDLIRSDGYLTLRNTTLTNFKGIFVSAPGGVSIYNSTFTNFAPGPLIESAKNSIFDTKMLVSNSLFDSGAIAACLDAGIFSSLGGNVATESSCGFSVSSGDKIVASTNLGSFGDHGGLVPTQAINGGGQANKAGNAQYCEALDARGYTRSPSGCDAGAYEAGGGSGALTANGLNGFYFDADANGHYVSLQRLDDSGNIAIVWDTFDSHGNQAWIYGVGQLTAKHVHASMSQNTGGVLQPGGPPKGSTVRAWGTVDIDLTSCALAQFSYQSSLDGFGGGQFPLTRLAFVSDFGCSD